MVNRLTDAPSDYLRQHAHQAIDWWEWGPEALAEAERTSRPIMLSVGYASCHWCHVMSAESFDDATIAAYLNEHFVSIKVDRQQRPDVDAVYMTATQALNGGQGGWPMTVFLTPSGQPFFAGTYFPPEPSDGLPAFREVLAAVSGIWEERHDDVLANAAEITAQLQWSASLEQAEGAPDLRAAIDAVEGDFDLIHAGFGQGAKFPMPTILDALLVKGDPQTLPLAQRTLEAMARGGICDQIGGGFHRYAVDPGWVVPHFEKMLLDNALLLGTFTRGWRRTADHDAAMRSLFERAAYGIVGWLEREMRHHDGGFIAGLDADSCDIRGAVFEGIFYLWNDELLIDVLGEDDGNWAADTFHVTKAGTFEDGLSTLQLRGRVDFDRLATVTPRLLEARETRFRPAPDRLVVAGWNGLTISSLVTGAMIFNEPHWLDLALGAAEYLARVHIVDGELRHSSIDGVVSDGAATAEDVGAVAEAFATLAGVTGDATWLRRAESLLDASLPGFEAADGGFHDTVEAGLPLRPRSFTDNVSPSGTMSLVRALRTVGLLAERPDLTERADAAARTTWPAVADSPRFAGSALEELLIDDEARRGLKRATVVVTTDDPFDELARAAWRLAPAGSVILRAAPGTEGFGTLLEGRDERAAYVCRGTVCFEPVTAYADLKTPLWSRA